MGNTLLALPCEVGEVSDGFHSFNELYEHRYVLFLSFAKGNPGAFKTRRDDSGEEWSGWFILGINTRHGQISYHLPEKYWDMIDVDEVERNLDYDGHSASDVLERLLLLLEDQ